MLIRNRTIFIFFSLTGLLLYLNSLNSPFHFDDIYFLKENLDIKSIPLWSGFTDNVLSLFNSRPLLLFTFHVNYILGGLDTFGYHLINVFIHVGNAFILYLLLRRHVDQDHEKGYSPKALLASLLFLIHPIATESITYISSRSSSLSTLFMFLSLYCFFRATEGKLRPASYLLGILFFPLALMIKQSSVVLPALLLLFDYFFISQGLQNLRRRLKYHLPYLLIICALSFLYVSYIYIPPSGAERPFLTHILTELKVFARYLGLLAVPIGLNIDHDVRPSVAADGPVIFAILLLFSLLSAAVLLRKKSPVFSFSVFWFFISVAPLLLVRLQDFMAERWIYSASAGFSIALAEVLFAIIRYHRRTGIIITAAVLLMGGTLTVFRNYVYSSPVLLWEDAAHKSPEKYRPLLNLSSAYMENSDRAKAIESAEKAIAKWRAGDKKNRDIVIAHINLAAAYGTDLKKAEAVLKLVEKEGSRYPAYYGVLGAAAMNAGEYKKAIVAFNKALDLTPQSPSFLFILGQCHEKLGQKVKAREYYSRAVTMVPQTAQEYMAQGEAFSILGDYRKASESFHDAIRADPLDVSMRTYLAAVLLKNGYYDQALEHYSVAAKISPGYAPAYEGMGRAKLGQGDKSAARVYLQKALSLTHSDSPERKDVEALLRRI